MGSYSQVGLQNAADVARVEICGRCGARRMSARDDPSPVESRGVSRFSTLRISKDEFVRFVEAEFDLADENKDGRLDIREFEHFLYSLSHPHKRLR
jgi:EF hand